MAARQVDYARHPGAGTAISAIPPRASLRTAASSRPTASPRPTASRTWPAPAGASDRHPERVGSKGADPLGGPGNLAERTALAAQARQLGEAARDRALQLQELRCLIPDRLERGDGGAANRAIVEYTRLADDVRQPAYQHHAAAYHQAAAAWEADDQAHGHPGRDVMHDRLWEEQHWQDVLDQLEEELRAIREGWWDGGNDRGMWR